MTKRYTTKQQILDDIDHAKSEAEKLRRDAEKIDEAANALFRVDNMVEEAVLKRQEAMRLRTKAGNLLEIRCRKLSQKLAEFETAVLPFMQDTSVDASLSDPDPRRMPRKEAV